MEVDRNERKIIAHECTREENLPISYHLVTLGHCDNLWQALVENMVKKNRSRFPTTVLLTTFLAGI